MKFLLLIKDAETKIILGWSDDCRQYGSPFTVSTTCYLSLCKPDTLVSSIGTGPVIPSYSSVLEKWIELYKDHNLYQILTLETLLL